MSYWEVLGIEATKDKRIIKITYTELLKKYPPTEFPEEFKKLRKAFELANKEAKRLERIENQSNTAEQAEDEIQNFNQVDDSLYEEDISLEEDGFIEFPEDRTQGGFESNRSDENSNKTGLIELNAVRSISQLQIALHELYTNVLDRSNVEKWKLLFSAPLFWDVDNNQKVSLCLLEFFAHNYFLPSNVLNFIDESLKLTSELVSVKNDHTRKLALSLNAYIKTFPLRIRYDSVLKANGNISFDQLYRHLQLRDYVENKCIYHSLDKSELVLLVENIQPVFQSDFDFYDYIVRWLWALDGYDEICCILAPLDIPVSLEDVMEYHAHSEFKRKNYEMALSLYLKIDTLDRETISSRVVFRYIGLCYLHLKQYDKAYFYLKSALPLMDSDISIRITLTSARRLYIKELRRNEEINAVEIATLQYDNGRYQDAMLMTQKYRRIFREENNYLEALCLAKLGQISEALSVFEFYIKRYKEKELLAWPLLVDLLIYCSDSVSDDFFFEYLLNAGVDEYSNECLEKVYLAGSYKEISYSEKESKVLDFSHNKKPVFSYKKLLDSQYSQFYALAVIKKFKAKLDVYDDPDIPAKLRRSAVFLVDEAIPKIKTRPSLAFQFLHAAYLESDRICIDLCDIVIGSFPHVAAAYYYKGLVFTGLERYEEAVSLLELSAQKYGNDEFGVYSLEYALEACEKAIEYNEDFNERYLKLERDLKTMKEAIDEY